MRIHFLLAVLISGCGGIASSDTVAAPDAPDAAPDSTKTCAGENMACETREDCCNGRHSCIGGACMYSAPVDAAPAVTFERDVQPLLLAKCVGCHDNDASGRAAPFVRSYAVLQQASLLCPGKRVGECVNEALQNQRPEGSACRTYVVEPFHREGWPCLTTAEIDLVAAWIAGGMLER